jgi:predicted esterase
MINSLLVMKNVPPLAGDARGVFVLLHGRGGDVDQLLPLAARLRPDFRSIAVEGPRTVVAYTVEVPDLFDGYEWYPAENGEPQELARFGHALASLEQLLVDVLREYEGLPLFLLGQDQGGSMALALASVMPEFLSGMVSIGGALPTIPSWSLDRRDLAGLPILLIGGGGALRESAAALREQGAEASLVSPVDSDSSALVVTIGQWMKRCEARAAVDLIGGSS